MWRQNSKSSTTRRCSRRQHETAQVTGWLIRDPAEARLPQRHAPETPLSAHGAHDDRRFFSGLHFNRHFGRKLLRLIESFTRSYTGHVQIHRSGYLDRPSLHKSFVFGAAAARRIEALPVVKAWIRRVYAPALAFAGSRSSGIQLIGVEARREQSMTGLGKTISAGRFLAAVDEIVLGFGVARSLRLAPGSEVALVTQGADGSIANDLFRVVGIAGSGDDLRNRVSCYVSL